ncbi:DUF2397 family protein (plasmid) [Streptomyces dangxiongensis]|uniref:DUF2397 family protein n=1 Tax=Streptomyces dangxiongensis TaxID=1442032 RepID=A0A3G2J658_9ACTN|nr:DUF2397 family protein [Streptomyces dangxiongensis]
MHRPARVTSEHFRSLPIVSRGITTAVTNLTFSASWPLVARTEPEGIRVTVDDTEDEDGQEAEREARRDLYRYVTADRHAAEYIAVMDQFTRTLLTDLSAAEVSEALAELGILLSAEEAETRCYSLVGWGNLLPVARDPRVPSIAALSHSRVRFQVTQLGALVHQQVTELLSRRDGAREVARELLGSMASLLKNILAQARNPRAIDAETLAADVTTVFTSHTYFTDTVRQFYAYLASVLARYDLAGEEYATFKGLLLEYVHLIDTDVSRYSPAVRQRLEELLPWWTMSWPRWAHCPPWPPRTELRSNGCRDAGTGTGLNYCPGTGATAASRARLT